MRFSRPRYLLRRGDLYYFRRALPQWCHTLSSRHEIKLSLWTADRFIARHRAALAGYLFEEILREVRKLVEGKSLPRDWLKYILNQYFLAVRREFRGDYEETVRTLGDDLHIQIDSLKEMEADLRTKIGGGEIPPWAEAQAISSQGHSRAFSKVSVRVLDRSVTIMGSNADLYSAGIGYIGV